MHHRFAASCLALGLAACASLEKPPLVTTPSGEAAGAPVARRPLQTPAIPPIALAPPQIIPTPAPALPPIAVPPNTLYVCVIDLKERRWLRPITCANPEPITFGEIVQRFARAKGRELTLVPVSWKLVWGMLRSLEALGLPTGFKSDSLVGLMNPNPNPDFQMQQELSLKFRPLP